MNEIRVIHLDIGPFEFPAVEQMLVDGINAGTSPETLMVLNYSKFLSILLGPLEDSAMLQRHIAEQHGLQYARRYLVGGGAGFFRADLTPTIYLFFKDNQHSFKDLVDAAGEAGARALRSVGIDAVYRPFGNIEFPSQETGLPGAKIGVSGGGYKDGVWGIFINVINKNFSTDEFGIIGQSFRLPKEKFEDKAVKSVAGRMMALEQMDIQVDIEQIMNAYTTEMARLVDRTPVKGAFSEQELATIEDNKKVFSAEKWLDHYNSKNFLQGIEKDVQVADVAYKTAKLIKLTIAVESSGIISRAMFTGDMYIKSAKSAYDAIEQISRAVEGLPVSDDQALLQAVQKVFAQAGFEAPYLKPEDFVAPIQRAREHLIPPSELFA